MGNYFRDLWRDMRGDVVWDGVRCVWNYIPSTLKSFVMTSVFAIWQWLANAPWTVLICLSSVIFGFTMLGIDRFDVFRERRQKRSISKKNQQEFPPGDFAIDYAGYGLGFGQYRNVTE